MWKCVNVRTNAVPFCVVLPSSFLTTLITVWEWGEPNPYLFCTFTGAKSENAFRIRNGDLTCSVLLPVLKTIKIENVITNERSSSLLVLFCLHLQLSCNLTTVQVWEWGIPHPHPLNLFCTFTYTLPTHYLHNILGERLVSSNVCPCVEQLGQERV